MDNQHSPSSISTVMAREGTRSLSQQPQVFSRCFHQPRISCGEQGCSDDTPSNRKVCSSCSESLDNSTMLVSSQSSEGSPNGFWKEPLATHGLISKHGNEGDASTSTQCQSFASSSSPFVLSVSSGPDADGYKRSCSSPAPGVDAAESQASGRLTSKPFKHPMQVSASSSHSQIGSESIELERILEEMKVPALRQPIETDESQPFKRPVHRLEDSPPLTRSSTDCGLQELERIFEEMRVPPLLAPFDDDMDDWQE